MYGAIIGDIIGSRREFHRITTKQIPLFSDKNGVTDDSILTVAVADALMNDKNSAECMRFWVVMSNMVSMSLAMARSSSTGWLHPPCGRPITVGVTAARCASAIGLDQGRP